ncbi:MAG: 6-bladed beta-propeller [Prolixibacteraceae bacterium]|nr:6-bladed beta-propeller [Prolixibacteraceae bacterium]
MKIHFLLPGMVVMALSCSKNQKTVESYTHGPHPVYPVSVNDENTLFKIDSVFRLESIVPLETSAISAMGELFKGIVHEGNFYMHDFFNNSLLVFAPDGRFMHRVGKMGKGPEEYLETRDFMINGNCIYTLDYKKIHCYALSEGKYQYTIPLNISEFNPLQFAVFDKNNYYLWESNPEVPAEDIRKDKHRLIRVKNGKVSGKYFRFTNECFDDQRFFRCADGNLYSRPVLGNYTVYTIAKDSVSASFRIDFGNKSLPAGYLKDKKNSLNDCLKNAYFKSPRKVYDIDDFVYFSNIGPGSFRYEGLINKQNKQVYYGRVDAKCNPVIFYSDGNFLYGYYEPGAFLKQDDCKSCSIFRAVKEKLQDKVSSNDNLIVVKLSLK